MRPGRSWQPKRDRLRKRWRKQGLHDYKKEYREYHGKPEQIAARSHRNAARATLGLAVGNPKEYDHKNPISNGGSNRKDNLRAVARSTTRKKGAK